MNHDQILRKRAGITQRTAVARILRSFDRADASTLEAGARWYHEAGDLASQLSGAHSREACAAVIAHLSPRTSWSRNIATATALLTFSPGAARDLGAIGANVDRAVEALNSENPLDTFGGPKTRAFAANIVGDREAVTVDVWAARVVGVTELELSRVGVYDAIAHAYRLAARARGVDPATMQATTWIVARNGRAA